MKYLLNHLESERLYFRKLEQNDFETWLALFEDEETAFLLGMQDYKTPHERCEKWFEWTFHRYGHDLGGQNVLISKDTGLLIGQCGLLVREINGISELEVAYSILPQYRRQSYDVETAQKCRDFAFENNFHHRLVSIIVPENENSKKVASKNGMQFSQTINFNNKLMDLYAITREEWLQNRKSKID